MRTAAIVALALGFAVPAAATAAPTVRLADTNPITVRVAGFAAHERVAVTFSETAGRWTRRGTTGASGALVLTFPGVRLDRCGGYALRAVGAHGETASWKTKPMMLCAPEQPPSQ